MFGGLLCVEFANLVMKIGEIVYHTVSFSNCPLLLYLKL